MSENMMMVRLLITLFLVCSFGAIANCGSDGEVACTVSDKYIDDDGFEDDSTTASRDIKVEQDSLTNSKLNFLQQQKENAKGLELVRTCEEREQIIKTCTPYLKEKHKDLTVAQIASFFTKNHVAKLPSFGSCNACLATDLKDFEPNKMLGEQISAKLDKQLLQMLEESIVARVKMVIEDNYILNSKKQDCGAAKWIDRNLSKETREISKDKLLNLKESSDAPSEIEIHTCGKPKNSKGKPEGTVIKLSEYKEKSEINDPSHRDNSRDLMLAMSYISKSTIKEIASTLYGSDGSGDASDLDEGTALDFLERFSNKSNIEALSNITDQLSSEESRNVKMFIRSLSGPNGVVNNKLSLGLMEEPSLRYIMSNKISRFQKRFRDLNFFEKVGTLTGKKVKRQLARRRRELTENPYGFMHNFEGKRDFAGKLTNIVKKGQESFCHDLEKDYKDYEEILSKVRSANKIFKYNLTIKKFEINDDVFKSFKKNGASVVNTIIDSFVEERGISEERLPNVYNTLATSKCKTSANGNYSNEMASSLPVNPKSRDIINKPVNPTSKNDNNRFTDWAKYYCSKPDEVNKLAASYKASKESWFSSHCTLMTCGLNPVSPSSNSITSVKPSEKESRTFAQIPSGINSSQFSSPRRDKRGLFNSQSSTQKIKSIAGNIKNTNRVDSYNPRPASSLDNKNRASYRNRLLAESKKLEREQGLLKKRDTKVKAASYRRTPASNFNQQGGFLSRSNYPLSNSRSSSRDQEITYSGKDNNELRTSFFEKLNSSVQGSLPDGFYDDVRGHPNFDKSEEILVSLNFSEDTSAEDIYEGLGEAERAIIKELLETGSDIRIINSNGVVWFAGNKSEKTLKLYSELKKIVQSDRDVNLKERPSDNTDVLRTQYLKLLQAIDKVKKSPAI